jgi:hypothetical protein
MIGGPPRIPSPGGKAERDEKKEKRSFPHANPEQGNIEVTEVQETDGLKVGDSLKVRSLEDATKFFDKDTAAQLDKGLKIVGFGSYRNDTEYFAVVQRADGKYFPMQMDTLSEYFDVEETFRNLNERGRGAVRASASEHQAEGKPATFTTFGGTTLEVTGETQRELSEGKTIKVGQDVQIKPGLEQDDRLLLGFRSETGLSVVGFTKEGEVVVMRGRDGRVGGIPGAEFFDLVAPFDRENF